MKKTMIMLASTFILLGAPGAFASGSHYHSNSQRADVAAPVVPTAENRTALHISFEASAVAANWAGGCVHTNHKFDHGKSACCGTACCFAALACNTLAAQTPLFNADIPRPIVQSLVLANASFGIDRPPDFRG